MAGKSESIEAFNYPNADWDTPYRSTPPSSVGEFAEMGTNPVVADLNALSFSETSRTPYDGFVSRDQSNFPTRDGGKNG